MGLLVGGALPDITNTTTKSEVAPDYYTDYMKSLTGAGATSMGRTGADSIAAYDPMQTTGYGQVEGAAGAYKTGLENAATTANTAAGGINANRLSALMNPYTQNVVDEMGRLSQQNMQRNVLPTMKAGFVGTGGLGSQRYANALGQATTEAQSNLTGQQYGALSSGYKDALDAAIKELQVQNTAAQNQGKIAEQEQTLGLTGAGALTKAGAEQQAYQQSILDAPMKNATNAAALMKGYTVPTTATTTEVGPKTQNYYAPSGLTQAGTLLSYLGAGATGTAGDAAFKTGSDLYNKLMTSLNNSSGLSGLFSGGFTGQTDEFGGMENLPDNWRG
tara:strand:+ start:539 stop:1534 length:996 start_codon:yes stop_codon:yes gene_type:complete